MNTITHWWGLPYPPEAKCAWGARAIYTFRVEPDIDLLPDRQSVSGDAKSLCDWLNKRGLNLLRKRRDDQGVGTNSRERVRIIDGKRFLEATPNASYGYLYIGAWELP